MLIICCSCCVLIFTLQEQEVTREMYDRQIDVIMSDLAPVMQKYAKILQGSTDIFKSSNRILSKL
jgi:oligoendopeptidase F